MADQGPVSGGAGTPGDGVEIDITDGAVRDHTPSAPEDDSPAGVGEDGSPARVDEPAAVGDTRDPTAAVAAAVAGSNPDAAAAAAETGNQDPGDTADPDAAPPLRKIVESILLVVDQPVPEVELAQVLEAPRTVILGILEDLRTEYAAADRGFELRQVAGGWRLYTAPDCAPYVERFVLEGQQARLTQAALETLAVVAYRQPVSRQAVSAIRGVNVDGVIRTLLGRGLISEAGEEGPGGAHLYVTTPYFLERLGIRSLAELPNLAPLLPADVDDLAERA
jgi:segregation and condensation protein B